MSVPDLPVNRTFAPPFRKSELTYSLAYRERGIALVVSLVVLVAVITMGIATMSGTNLNEKIASNSQQKSVAFEVAESAIASVWNKAYLSQALISGPGTNENDPEPVTLPESDTNLASKFDIKNGSGTTIINAEGMLTVQYCGETTPVGSDLNADESATSFMLKLIDINSIVKIANSGASANHVQRAAMASAKTNRTGNCPIR